MSELERWLDAPGELEGEELRVLRAGSSVEPPASMVDQVWSGLALQLAAPLAGEVSAIGADAATTTGGGAAASSVGGAGAAAPGAAGGLELATSGALGSAQAATMSATLAQLVAAPLALGALAGTLLMGGAMLVSESAPAPASSLVSAQSRSGREPSARRTAPAPAEAPRSITGAPLGDEPGPLGTGSPSSPRASAARGKTQRQEAVAAAAQAPAEGPSRPEALPGSRAELPPVAEGVRVDAGSAQSPGGQTAAVNAEQRHATAQAESRAIAEAREALRSGNVATALSTLGRARSLFPDGILRQEREALTIEALVRSGQRASARARAAAFLDTYPRSPHAAQVRRVVGLE